MNLLVDSGGDITLVDFGLSTETENGKHSQELYSHCFGTPEYMSPEKLGKCAYSDKADVWSAGLVIAKMLTGEKVDFIYLDHKDYTYRIDKNAFRSFLSRVTRHKNVSNEWATLIRKLLALKETDRPSAYQALQMEPLVQKASASAFGLMASRGKSIKRLYMLESALAEVDEKRHSLTIEGVKRTRSQVVKEIDILRVRLEEEQGIIDKRSLQSQFRSLESYQKKKEEMLGPDSGQEISDAESEDIHQEIEHLEVLLEGIRDDLRRLKD